MKNLCIAIIIVVVVIVVFISFLNQSIHFYKYLQESNVYVDPRSVILNSKFSFRIIYFTHFSCQKFSYNTIFPLSFFLDSWIPSIKKKRIKVFKFQKNYHRVRLISSFISSFRKNLIRKVMGG